MANAPAKAPKQVRASEARAIKRRVRNVGILRANAHANKKKTTGGSGIQVCKYRNRGS